MATFGSVGGVKIPENDSEGKPIIFDSYDMYREYVRQRTRVVLWGRQLHGDRATAL